MDDKTFPRMHVSLYVGNIAQTVAFYDTFFKHPADKVKAGYAKYMLSEPALIISFVENAKLVRPEFGHLGFQVATQAVLDQRLQDDKTLQLVSLEEKDTACCYAKQDKYWVTDPDGYRWEVYYFHEDVEFNDPRYQEEAEACCSPTMTTKPELPLAEVSSCCSSKTTGTACC